LRILRFPTLRALRLNKPPRTLSECAKDAKQIDTFGHLSSVDILVDMGYQA
jgi:hypothetical protein